MNITLNNIADLYLDKWAGGMQHGDIQDYKRSTILKIRSILNGILRIEALNNRNEGDKTGPGYAIANYDLTVAITGGVASVTLPDIPISLPYNGGIHRVFPKDRKQGSSNDDRQRYSDFVRTFNPGVSSKTKAGNYPSYKYYWQEGNKICFRGAYQEPDEDMNVTVQILVAAPDTVGIDDALPISPDQMEEVLKRLDLLKQPVVPVDKTNNNAPQA